MTGIYIKLMHKIAVWKQYDVVLSLVLIVETAWCKYPVGTLEQCLALAML